MDKVKTTHFVCPTCNSIFEEEEWRVEDGPCSNNKFYCVECIINFECGCSYDCVLLEHD